MFSFSLYLDCWRFASNFKDLFIFQYRDQEEKMVENELKEGIIVDPIH
jgi:hypothetical protein